MSTILPPTPTGVPPGHSFWNQWYEQLRNLINNGAVSTTWANINFSGGNITNIPTRLHNSLQGLQGGTAGEAYHLTAAQVAVIGAGNHNDLASLQGGTTTERYHLTAQQYNRITSTQTKAGLPTTADISAGQWAIYKDTSGGSIRLWANDGGVMKSVILT
jgi:hypothetical protein